MVESEQPNKWGFFFSFRRLPPEFADVERLTGALETLIILLIIPFFPGYHYLGYILCSLGIFIGGRVLAFFLHGRISPSSQERFVRPVLLLQANLFISLGIVALAASVYYVWKDADPDFMVISLLCAAPLFYFLGSRKTVIKTAMGLLDIALIGLSLILYFTYSLPGFIITAVSAGFFAWALLLKKGTSTPLKPTQT